MSADLLRRPRQAALTLAALVLAGLTGAGLPDAVLAAAGEVEFVRGAGSVQRPGQTARLLGRGQALEEGDVVTTGRDSSAIIKLTDGTRITMRADSKFVLQNYEYKPDAPANEPAGSMAIGLLKGGLRTLTGIIPKRNTDAAKVITTSATVGIRGTDFDVRLCQKDDCPRDPNVRDTRPLSTTVSARIVTMQGTLAAIGPDGSRRLLAVGAPLYPGDTIESSANAHAVLAFRDDSKVTVQPASRLKIEDFVFDREQPREGRSLLSLARGGMRAFTGIIGRTNPNNVRYTTATATVGIRGTGVDLCVGCSGTGETDTTAAVWDGSIVFTANPESCSAGSACSVQLSSGEAAIVPAAGGVATRIPVPTYMQFTTPQPNQVPVPQNFWSAAAPPAATEGLYVFVRDGHVTIASANEVLNLGRNEAGFAGAMVLRLESLPLPLSTGFRTGIVNDLVQRTNTSMMCPR